MKKTISTIITLAALSFPVFVAGQDLSLGHRFGHTAYRAGDTVVVGIKAGIPSGYHLYGNPLGPGIGKPLKLFINRVTPNDDGDNNGIDYRFDVPWAEARKSAPKKYKPQVGEWVWAYESEAYFFIKGILNIDGGGKAVDNQKIKYEVFIEALICRTSCVPIEKRITFELPLYSDISNKYDTSNKSATLFSDAPNWRARYAKSEPMEFTVGAPVVPRIGLDSGGDALQIGVQLDFGGLSGLSARSSSDSLSVPDGGSLDIQAGENVAADDDGIIWDYVPVEDKREYNLLTAVLFALLAGLALNLTPCIFPLLGVRVLSFAESARESRRRAVVRSAAFSCGIVAVFLLLAAFAAFAGFSWGQQFQNPAIMTVIIAVIFLFALGMFDFYTMSAPSAVGNAERRAGATLFGDFLKGAAATVMATPCGGPFLGALLAWALLQKPLTIFILFAMMGVGMALPYVLLSSIKKLQQLLPKPGRWIEDFKHIMGFVLLLFAVNLLKSLDAGLTVTAVGICLSILCAASVNKRFAPFGASAARRLTVGLAAVLMLTVGTVVSVVYLRNNTSILNDNPSGEINSMHIIGYGGINNTRTVDNAISQEINPNNTIGYDGINNIEIVDNDLSQKINPANTIGYDNENHISKIWNEFSPYALRKAQTEGRNVIVNFTASWCTNCKLNKAAALDIPAARQIYADKNIVLLTADITNYNPQAQSLLSHLGSRSVPFVALFPSDSPRNPIIMRDILNKDKYLKALRELP